MVSVQKIELQMKLLNLPGSELWPELRMNRMPRYILSVKAEKDQDDIADYTLETWGEKEALDYIVGLVDCLEKIAETLISDGMLLNSHLI